MEAEMVVYRTRSVRRSQRWAWRLVAANGRVIADSAEGYRDQGDAVEMARRVADGGYAVRFTIQV